VTQPLDRVASLPELGEVDEEAGEFWVGNAFMMPANGDNLSAYEQNVMYLNAGDSFLDVSFASLADIDSDSRTVIPADFDGDGRMDLLVGSVGGGPLRLFMNRFPADANRVVLKLRGVQSNRPAIGTRVVLHCGDRQIVRDLFAANGFMGQAPATLLIGVGQAESIDRLEVRWPTGKTQEFKSLGVNTTLSIIEGEAEVESSSF
jgi:hypothetical protein